jgi:tRNA pseudouridine55 synthase
MTGSGLVIVAKPAGMTSHDVVGRIRRLAGTRRVGHAGTLDPMATGVLVVGVEKATRLLGHLALTEKDYTATIRLGQSTTTDDAEGELLPPLGAPAADQAVAGPAGQVVAGQARLRLPDGAAGQAREIPEQRLRSALAALTGEIQQVPPGFSAIKINGRRAYQLARAGEAPDLAARTVTVSRLELIAISPRAELLDIDVEITCSSGTYIRAIARDLGTALGVGGHLTALSRTRVGPYLIGQARTLEQLAESFELVPLARAAAAAFPHVDLSADEARMISRGVRLAAAGRADLASTGRESAMPVAAFDPDGALVALLVEQDGEFRSLAVFVT